MTRAPWFPVTTQKPLSGMWECPRCGRRKRSARAEARPVSECHPFTKMRKAAQR